jgi:hypothetical protein
VPWLRAGQTYRETLMQTLNRLPRSTHSVSHEQCIGISNKQVCGQATDSPIPLNMESVALAPAVNPSSVPSGWRASSAASKMHSFVHGPSPPTCTAPHHESTALLWPLQSAATDHLPKTLSPVGHRRVTARPNGSAVYAMVEGGGSSARPIPLLGYVLLPWALAMGPRRRRGWMLCVVVSTRRHSQAWR